jgi:hypothetical protein
MLVQQAIPYRDPVWTNDGTAIDELHTPCQIV